jgi:deoxyribonuclease-4
MILDINKKVGVSVAYDGSLITSIQGFNSLPCVQVGYKKYNEGYCNDAHQLVNIPLPYVYLHSSVMTNIANIENKRVLEPSIKHLNSIVTYTSFIPASVIVHYGAKGNLDKTIESVSRLTLKQGPGHYPLLLENAAGEGTELGVTVDEIRYVFERIDSSKVGMCLDTCHAFGAGYHVEQTECLIKLLEELEAISSKRLKMIHLNDSKKPCASRIDRHENIAQGYIWSQDQSSLEYLLNYGADMGLHFILETPDPIASLQYLKTNHMRLKRR